MMRLLGVVILLFPLGKLGAAGPNFPDQVPLASDATEHRTVAEVPAGEGNFTMRFSGRVDLDVEGRLDGQLTAQRDINFDARLACLVVRQLDAAGRELAVDASLGAARPGRHALEVEVAPVPGAVRAVLECRFSELRGKAVFSDFRWEPRAAPLYESAAAQRATGEGKAPALEVDGRIRPPLMVHGQNLETSADAAASLEDLALPYARGLRMFSFNAWFPGVTRQDTRANLESLAKVYPEARFLIRVWIGPRGTFFKDYPGERLALGDGQQFADVATPTSAVWRRYVDASIRRFVMDVRKSPSASLIAGIIPMYYVTGEWQLGDPANSSNPWTGFGEPHRTAFANWAMKTHGGLEGLNAAWATNYGSADEISVPTVEERERASWGVLRDPRTDRRIIDHARFLSLAVSDAILWSSEAFRTAFGNRIVTGPFYGHILEHAWSAPGVQQQGHLAIARLLDSPLIDFHGSPYSYGNDSRFPGLPVVTNAILDSANLHGKAAFLEEDTYTHVAKPREGFIAPGAHQQTKSLEETLDVLKRNLGTSLARGYIHYWMGLLQDGRFNLPEIWDAYAPVIDWLEEQPVRPAYCPQVALVVDENALPYLAERHRGVVGRWLYELRNILGRVDTTVGIYLQSDLDKIPKSVRCLVLATPYQLDEDTRTTLRNRWMKDGRVIVFGQFPDLFDDNARRAVPGEITGMKLEMLDSPVQPVSRITGEGIFAPWGGLVVGEPVDRAVLFWRKGKLPPPGPLVSITDLQATALARYENLPKQQVSVALKEMNGWTSMVTGVHSLPPAIWREIFRAAGTHLYFDELHQDFDRPDVIEATSDFIMVISGRAGERTLHLPKPAKLVPLDGGTGESQTSSATHTLSFEAGKPRLFRLE